MISSTYYFDKLIVFIIYNHLLFIVGFLLNNQAIFKLISSPQKYKFHNELLGRALIHVVIAF